MNYLIPEELNDAWGWLYYRHRAYTTYLMEVPLKVRIIEQEEDDPFIDCIDEPFKARTYSDIIEFSSWYVAQHKSKPSHLAYVTAHEIGHQMMRHDVVHHRWFKAGKITGYCYDGSPAVTYPYDERIVQWAFDYQINDGLNRCGFVPPVDALHDPIIGTWFDLEETIYVRLYAAEQSKRNTDPEDGRGDAAEQGGQSGSTLPGGAGDPSRAGQRDDRSSHEHGSAKIGCGLADVIPHDGGDTRIDDLERRRNAFEKMLAELDPDKTQGLSQSNVEKLFNRLHPRPMKWFDIIRPRFRSLFGGDVATWQRFDRAAFARGFTLPGRVVRTAGTLCLVLDTSGSVGRNETVLYIARLIELVKECRPRAIYVLECDTSVHRVTKIKHPHELRRFTEPMLRGEAGLLGNGGTRLNAAHDWLIEHDIKPDLTLYFTDMGTTFPTGKGNSKEVLWIATTDYKQAPAAAGRTIRMTMA